MTIDVDGEQKRIGLSLSGGGFRAAGFHLGVFRKLEELNLLWDIDVLSCVSGGSIAGAHLALNWKKADALDNLEDYLTGKSIDVGTTIAGVLNPFKSRIEMLSDSYDSHLFKNQKLSELKSGPRIYLNATNLATGNLFFFVAGGGGECELGEHELGQFKAPEFKIADAVAASSAFPPVYPPLVLDNSKYPFGDVDCVALTDGGVYDNLGVNPLLAVGVNDLDYAIVSDAGKPFEVDETPTDTGFGVLKESIGVMMEQIRGLQFSKLEFQYKANLGPKPIWFSIDRKSKGGQPDDAEFASSIPTRLKRLTNPEIEILKRHGAELIIDRLTKYAPEII